MSDSGERVNSETISDQRSVRLYLCERPHQTVLIALDEAAERIDVEPSYLPLRPLALGEGAGVGVMEKLRVTGLVTVFAKV